MTTSPKNTCTETGVLRTHLRHCQLDWAGYIVEMSKCTWHPRKSSYTCYCRQDIAMTMTLRLVW